MHRHAETRFCNFCGSTAPTDSLLASFEAIHFESRDPLTPCIVSLSLALSCFKLCSKVLGHWKKRWYLGLWWPKFTFQPQKCSEVMQMHCLSLLKQVQNCSEHTGYYQTWCFFSLICLASAANWVFWNADEPPLRSSSIENQSPESHISERMWGAKAVATFDRQTSYRPGKGTSVGQNIGVGT